MDRLQGTVIATHGPLVTVQVEDRTMVVTSRRRITWEGGTPTVPRIVVGDHVIVETVGDDGVIVSARTRTSCLLRRAPSSARAQILAANVDQALLVFAASQPEPKRGLLDRFLVACHLAGIDAVITINKVDQGTDDVEAWLGIYERLGYTVFRVSARTAWGLGRVKRQLAGRTTLFCGPSGAGKSSLLNSVYPGFRLKVGTISEATGKGRHTTSRAELMPLPYGGFVVDTPGLKEFGLWSANRRDIEAAFPEIDEIAARCRYPDCSHLHEPECAVQKAVEEGAIDDERYRSFAKLLEDIE